MSVQTAEPVSDQRRWCKPWRGRWSGRTARPLRYHMYSLATQSQVTEPLTACLSLSVLLRLSLAVRLTLCLTLCPHTLCFASQACHPRYCSLLTILDVLFLFTWCPATSTPLSLHLQATIGHSRNELNSTSKSITEGLWRRSGWRTSGGVLRQIRMRLGQHSLEAEFGMLRKY